MAITTEMIKQLRETTGAGILDCRKALETANGDMQKAIDVLREKGLAMAAKRAGRQASEGVIELYAHENGRVGVMVEVNCETDFVGRSDAFRTLAHELALHIANAAPLFIREEDVPADFTAHSADEPVLLKQPYYQNKSITVQQFINEKVVALGENVIVRRFARWTLEGAHSETIELYTHGNGRVGVMAQVSCSADSVSDSEAFKTLTHELALQIAAASPLYISEKDIPADVIAHETEIATAKAHEEKKPDAVVARIVEGSLNKYKDETVLLRQPYIRDESMTVEQLVKKTAASLGGDMVVRRFARWALGETSKEEPAEE
jgi:elongation factor Ts